MALQRPIMEINLLKRIKLIAIAAPLILAVCSTACHQNRTAQLQTASRSRNLPVMQVSVGAPVEYTTVGSVDLISASMSPPDSAAIFALS